MNIPQLLLLDFDLSRNFSLNLEFVSDFRKTATLQADLSDSTQKVAKLQAAMEEQLLTNQREISLIQSKHEQEMKENEQQLETMVMPLEMAG